MSDPWKHRSRGMKCRSCMWFARKTTMIDGTGRTVAQGADPKDATEEYRHQLGRCRRHAPAMNGYPAVFEDDWCGDHKMDENKI